MQIETTLSFLLCSRKLYDTVVNRKAVRRNSENRATSKSKKIISNKNNLAPCTTITTDKLRSIIFIDRQIIGQPLTFFRDFPLTRITLNGLNFFVTLSTVIKLYVTRKGSYTPSVKATPVISLKATPRVPKMNLLLKRL